MFTLLCLLCVLVSCYVVYMAHKCYNEARQYDTKNKS